MSKAERWALRVPVNKKGEQFTESLRKYLNKGRYKVDRRWTGPRPKGTNQHSTSKENATSARLYNEDKFPVKDNYWYDEVLERYVSKTTAREAIKELEHIKNVLRCLV